MTKPDPDASQKAKALLDEFRVPDWTREVHLSRTRADNLEIRIGQLITEAKPSADRYMGWAQ